MKENENTIQYDRLYDWENLRLAYKKASRGKRGKAAAAIFEYALAGQIL